MKGFRDFLNQGNVVQLAVAFIIGGAFGAVVTALVVDVINPIIAIPFGKPNFDNARADDQRQQHRVRHVPHGAWSHFVLIAAGVYFFFVMPYNRLQARTRSATPAECNTRACPECLSIIPKAAHRCSACTAVVEPQAYVRSRRPSLRCTLRTSRTDVRRRSSGFSRSGRTSSSWSRTARIATSMRATRRPTTVHLWIEDAGWRVVSTLRLLSEGLESTASVASRRSPMRAVAVTRARLLRRAIELSGPPIVLSAQAYLVDWYARFGFEVCGEHWIRGRHRARADAPRRQAVTMLTMRSTTAITFARRAPVEQLDDAWMRERLRGQRSFRCPRVDLELATTLAVDGDRDTRPEWDSKLRVIGRPRSARMHRVLVAGALPELLGDEGRKRREQFEQRLGVDAPSRSRRRTRGRGRARTP